MFAEAVNSDISINFDVMCGGRARRELLNYNYLKQEKVALTHSFIRQELNVPHDHHLRHMDPHGCSAMGNKV